MNPRMLAAIGAVLATSAAHAADAKRPSLQQVHAVLQSSRFVDLTHPFHPGIPHWK